MSKLELARLDTFMRVQTEPRKCYLF